MYTMARRLVCLLLIFIFSAATLPVAAEGLEYLENGDFEIVNDLGGAKGWRCNVDEEGIYYLSTEGKKSSRGYALKKETVDPYLYTSQMVEGIHEEAQYTFTIWYKVQSAKGKATARIACLSASKESKASGLDETTKNFETDKFNTWKKLSISFSTPQKTRAVLIELRLYGGGEIIFDDASLICTTAGLTDTKADMGYQPYEEPALILPPIDGTGELLDNTGFEDGTAGVEDVWGAYGGWNGGYVFHTDKLAHSGKKSVVIKSGDDPWIGHPVKDLRPGATYQVSFWARITKNVVGRGMGVHFEAYNSLEENAQTYMKDATQAIGYFNSTDGEWKKYSYTYKSHEDTKKLYLHLRMYGTGEVYIDDVSLMIVQDARGEDFHFSTDRIFYYCEDTSMGEAFVTLNTAGYPELMNSTVDFSLCDGDTPIATKNGVSFVGEDSLAKSSFQFSPDVMTKMQKDYYMRAVVHDGEGNVRREFHQRLCVYHRPSSLRSDGIYLKDGKPFMPVLAYHLNESDYAEARKMGVNTVVLGYHLANYEVDPTRIDTALDICENHGLSAVVALYRNMSAAGSPSNFENTRLLVEHLKGDKRVIGYAVMDEPSYYNVRNHDLYNSYRIIRDSDPDAVVYLLDCSQEDFAESTRFSDVCAFDPYPCATAKKSFSTVVGDKIATCVEEVEPIRPVYSVVQTFEALLKYPNPCFPTANEVRHQMYQSLFAGAKGVGFFTISDAVNAGGYDETRPANTTLVQNERWEDLAKMAPEVEEAAKVFVTGEYNTFYEEKSADAWYRLYNRNGEIRVVIISLSDTDTKTIQVPLQNKNGTIRIGTFTAKPLWGVGGDVTGNGSLSLNLAPKAAAVYRVLPTPAVGVCNVLNGDFSEGIDGWQGESDYVMVVENALRITAAVSPEKARQAVLLENGKTYRVTFSFQSGGVAAPYLKIDNTPYIFMSPKPYLWQTYSCMFTAENESNILELYGNVLGKTVQYDDISITECLPYTGIEVYNRDTKCTEFFQSGMLSVKCQVAAKNGDHLRLIAVYKKGDSITVAPVATYTASENCIAVLNTELLAEENDEGVLRAFLWDEKMSPLADDVTIRMELTK